MECLYVNFVGLHVSVIHMTIIGSLRNVEKACDIGGLQGSYQRVIAEDFLKRNCITLDIQPEISKHRSCCWLYCNVVSQATYSLGSVLNFPYISDNIHSTFPFAWFLSPFLFRHVCKIAKSDCSVMSVCLSFRQCGKIRLPLDVFSWNLVFEDFSKICRENSRLSKTWQK
jgi:hypothetical protein